MIMKKLFFLFLITFASVQANDLTNQLASLDVSLTQLYKLLPPETPAARQARMQREQVDREAREKVAKEAKEKAAKEAKEKADREKVEKEAVEKVDQDINALNQQIHNFLGIIQPARQPANTKNSLKILEALKQAFSLANQILLNLREIKNDINSDPLNSIIKKYGKEYLNSRVINTSKRLPDYLTKDINLINIINALDDVLPLEKTDELNEVITLVNKVYENFDKLKVNIGWSTINKKSRAEREAKAKTEEEARKKKSEGSCEAKATKLDETGCYALELYNLFSEICTGIANIAYLGTTPTGIDKKINTVDEIIKRFNASLERLPASITTEKDKKIVLDFIDNLKWIFEHELISYGAPINTLFTSISNTSFAHYTPGKPLGIMIDIFNMLNIKIPTYILPHEINRITDEVSIKYKELTKFHPDKAPASAPSISNLYQEIFSKVSQASTFITLDDYKKQNLIDDLKGLKDNLLLNLYGLNLGYFEELEQHRKAIFEKLQSTTTLIEKIEAQPEAESTKTEAQRLAATIFDNGKKISSNFERFIEFLYSGFVTGKQTPEDIQNINERKTEIITTLDETLNLLKTINPSTKNAQEKTFLTLLLYDLYRIANNLRAKLKLGYYTYDRENMTQDPYAIFTDYDFWLPKNEVPGLSLPKEIKPDTAAPYQLENFNTYLTVHALNFYKILDEGTIKDKLSGLNNDAITSSFISSTSSAKTKMKTAISALNRDKIDADRKHNLAEGKVAKIFQNDPAKGIALELQRKRDEVKTEIGKIIGELQKP